MPGRLALFDQLVGFVIGHQRGIVKQPEFALDAQGLGAEIPGRRAHTHRPFSANPLESIGCTEHQVPLDVIGKLAVELMDPAMDAKFMSLGGNAPLLVLVEQRRDRGDEEGRLGVMFCKRVENRGTPLRLPYWPCDIRPMDLPPSRSSFVS